MSKTHLGYRPEIDGLRAVAVLVVIIYHAQFIIDYAPFMSGGYIGVDVFFVISGYLITRLILAERQETGRFSFINFYNRRVRRIVPILFTVMLVSFPFAYHFLMPADFVEYSKSVLSAVFFSANFFFYNALTEYGAESSLLKPFLHAWSLGVEEQFYIVFPVLLIICYRYLKPFLLPLLIVLFLGSLYYADQTSFFNPELGFYSPLTRFWELMAGAVLAFLELRYGRIKHKIAAEGLSVLGVALVGYAFLKFDDSIIHPGYMTLIPVIGTMLIIAFASRGDVVGDVLSSKVLVGIGLISYSAYLWHYPLFAFARISDSEPEWWDKLIWIAATFVLSVVSYFAIEKPFRKKLSGRIFYPVIVIAFVLIALMQGMVLRSNGYEGRIAGFITADIQAKPWEELQQGGEKCFDRIENFCTFGRNGAPEIILLGDSHLAALAPAFIERYSADHHIQVLLHPGCFLPFENVTMIDRVGKCKAYNDKRMTILKGLENATIVIFLRTPMYLEGEFFENGTRQAYGGRLEPPDVPSIARDFDETYGAILGRGNRMVLIYPYPEVGFNVPKKIMVEGGRNPIVVKQWLKDNPITVDYAAFEERTQSTRAVYDALSSDRVVRVYPDRFLCNTEYEGRCATHTLDEVYYADSNHPSVTAVGMIMDMVVQELDVSQEPQ